jgi:hypothetical protein
MTQSPFYTGLILPGISIGAGAIAAMLLPAGKAPRVVIVVTITVILGLTTWFAPVLWPMVMASPVPITLLTLAIVATLACLPMLTSLSYDTGPRACVLVLLLSLNGLSLALNQDTRTLYRLKTSINNVEYFDGAMFVRSLINATALGGRVPLFWFDRTEFSTRDGRSADLVRTIRYADRTLALNFYDTLAGLRLWDRALFMAELRPEQSIEPTPALLGGNATMVVVEQNPVRLKAAIDALDAAGLNCRIHATNVYESQSFVLRITLIDILKNGDGCKQHTF